MGGRATKPIRQFPKSPDNSTSTATNRPFNGPKENQMYTSEQRESFAQEETQELTEEEIKREQEAENEMREYLATLQELTGSIQQEPENTVQRIVPEGVRILSIEFGRTTKLLCNTR